MGSPRIATQQDSAGEVRLALAAQFISAGARVLEIGDVSLAARLPFGCIHGSARREAVSPDAAGKYDVVVMLEPPRSASEADAFLHRFAGAERPLLVSFRSGAGLAFHDFIRIVGDNGLRIETSAVADDDVVMRLTPMRKVPLLAPCSVALVSGTMTFAERLGCQMLTALLPGEANLHVVHPAELDTARDHYDLLVLGSGQGLFHPLYAGAVIDLIDRADAAIGVFGTMQRELLPRAAFERLLDHLDIWFARSRDDVMLYGRGRDNVVYLGDWLIGQFPLAQGRDKELLTVSDHSLQDLPLDRAIAAIQRHRAVFARSLAPLCCALNSADTVAYADDLAAPSGEFRSLLLDIFGRGFPANEFFEVDRDAVMRYRARVHRNAANMRRQIDDLLRRVKKTGS